MQIPILNGIYANSDSDFRTSYPVNLIPVPKQNGISSGYLRPAEGIDFFTDVSGIDRGGINWNGFCYRVCGTSLIKVDASGDVISFGEITGTDYVSFAYSFDYLAICADDKLYLFDGSELKQVTDGDLGLCKDIMWIDGYFMSTDGDNLVVTELNDPFAVNALKYGSAEIDPDPIMALEKIRNEVWAIGRYTIEIFDNIGGDNFPFARIDGAAIPRGTLGKNTSCIFLETLAFLGSMKNEPVAIWLASNGSSQKISNREIEQLLHNYDENVLKDCLLETRAQDGHVWLYLHLPDQTLVYDASASNAVEEPVWFKLSSGINSISKYNARNAVWCYDKWIIGHPTENKLGVMAYDHSKHWGELVGWEFQTTIIYNDGRGAIFHQIELVSLTGYVNFNNNPAIYTQYSLDGELWSMPKHIHSGKVGNRAKRLVWFQQGRMRNWRVQKFIGNSDSRLTFARLEAQLEPLAV